MAEMFDRQIDRWQLLADRVKDELTGVQKALVQATARRNEMAAEAAKLRQMKAQYLQGSDRATTTRSQHRGHEPFASVSSSPRRHSGRSGSTDSAAR